jgi:hypothetical protein
MRLKELKLKNRVLTFLIFVALILLSSCNQEEGKFVLSQYSFSNTQKFEILNEKSSEKSVDGIIPITVFNQAVLVSSGMSLSYGASFTKDSVKINQMKISNNQFNWKFSPIRFEDNDTQYFGAKNLIIPNDKMLGESFNCDIFLEDGTIINDSIINQKISIRPLKEKLSVLDDMVLIIDSASITTIDLIHLENLDLLDESADANYVIRLYKDKKLLLERELNLGFSTDYYLFKSSYLKSCDTIFLAKKISNSTLSCNLYTIK